MQFMPGTWAIWGITGFGPVGTPDIMNPLDAVPSAARMLCADGGGNSATLASAIFSYNHATWYVNEVLALAGEYAQNNPEDLSVRRGRRRPQAAQAGQAGDRAGYSAGSSEHIASARAVSIDDETDRGRAHG